MRRTQWRATARLSVTDVGNEGRHSDAGKRESIAARSTGYGVYSRAELTRAITVQGEIGINASGEGAAAAAVTVLGAGGINAVAVAAAAVPVLGAGGDKV